jgi:OFA family oxalate/formate antiporter-like MFS transporter
MLNSFIAPIIIEFCRSFNIDENTISLTYIPMAIGVAGVLQCIGAFTWGFIARRIGVLKAFPLLYAFQTIATFMIISLSRIGIEAVIIAIWLRYLMFGGEPIIHMMVIPTLFGERNLGKLLGLQTSSVMASSIIAPLLGGIVRDLTGFFITTVATSAMFSLLATIIATIVVLFRHRIESL